MLHQLINALFWFLQNVMVCGYTCKFKMWCYTIHRLLLTSLSLEPVTEIIGLKYKPPIVITKVTLREFLRQQQKFFPEAWNQTVESQAELIEISDPLLNGGGGGETLAQCFSNGCVATHLCVTSFFQCVAKWFLDNFRLGNGSQPFGKSYHYWNKLKDILWLFQIEMSPKLNFEQMCRHLKKVENHCGSKTFFNEGLYFTTRQCIFSLA